VLIVGLPIIVLALFIGFVVWLVRRLMRPAVPAAA
jgi:flagellar biogenesis protein FliO